jgi:hypothetical protein
MFYGSQNHLNTPHIFRLNWNIKFCRMFFPRKIHQVYGFRTVRVNWGDYCEKEGNERGRETGGDEDEAEEQPALESIAVVGEDAAEKNAMTSGFYAA